jgi:hypothetical protein
MTVIILPRNNEEVDIQAIQDEIETKLSIPCEHSESHCERKHSVYDEVGEFEERKLLKAKKKRAPNSEKSIIEEQIKNCGEHHIICPSKIIIHNDVLKFNGEKLTIDDIPESFTFGNGMSATEMKLDDGQHIPMIICVVPHSEENTVKNKIEDINKICNEV